jgi:hypothetical protein
MAHEDAGSYKSKHPGAGNVRKDLAEAVGGKVADGTISCAQAERIAAELKLSMGEVGVAVDLAEIRIVKCQLGLFGYGTKKMAVKPADAVAFDLEQAIRRSLVNGRMPCLAAWEIARQFGVKKMDVSAACEALKIKVKPCQLGAF